MTELIPSDDGTIRAFNPDVLVPADDRKIISKGGASDSGL